MGNGFSGCFFARSRIGSPAGGSADSNDGAAYNRFGPARDQGDQNFDARKRDGR